MRRGDLIRTIDGHVGIVLSAHGSDLEVFLGNGLHCIYWAGDVFQLAIREALHPTNEAVANFAEILKDDAAAAPLADEPEKREI